MDFNLIILIFKECQYYQCNMDYISNIVQIAILKATDKRYCKCCGVKYLTEYEKQQVKNEVININVTHVIQDIYKEVQNRFMKNNSIESFLSDKEKKFKFNFIVDKLAFGFELSTIYYFDNEYTISHRGDILVGFYAKNEVSFTLRINDFIISKYNLKKNQFVWAYDNKYVIPLISLQYTKIFVENYENLNDIVLIYAHLDLYERRKLAQYPVYYHTGYNDYILVKNGLFKKQNNILDILKTPHTQILEADQKIRTKAAQTIQKKWLKCYYNPESQICKKRQLREYNNLIII